MFGPTLTKEILIHAPPSLVRDVFLDFENMHEWSKGHAKSLTGSPPRPPSSSDPKYASWPEPGTKITLVLMNGFTVTNVVDQSTPNKIVWTGHTWGIPGIFTGVNEYRFEPVDGGKSTHFTKIEKFWGILTPVMYLKAGELGRTQEIMLRELKERTESLNAGSLAN